MGRNSGAELIEAERVVLSISIDAGGRSDAAIILVAHFFRSTPENFRSNGLLFSVAWLLPPDMKPCPILHTCVFWQTVTEEAAGLTRIEVAADAIVRVRQDEVVDAIKIRFTVHGCR